MTNLSLTVKVINVKKQYLLDMSEVAEVNTFCRGVRMNLGLTLDIVIIICIYFFVTLGTRFFFLKEFVRLYPSGDQNVCF